MPSYQFSTVKIDPQSARREAVAVGVILYDRERGVVWRRFTDNWGEVRRRTGLSTLPDIGSAADPGPTMVRGDYLADVSAGQFPDLLLVTPPNNLMEFDTPDDALEWVFKANVGLPTLAAAAAAGGGRGRGRGRHRPDSGADALLGGRIEAMGFAYGSYRRGYEFRLGSLGVRFPHVFLKDGVPCEALFAASIASNSAAGAIRRHICDIASIKRWHGGSVAFGMCAVESGGGAGPGGPAARNALGLLRKWGVDVVYWDGVGDALGRIRDRVSAPSAAQA